MKLFSIYDCVSKKFGPVIPLQNLDVAKRTFIQFIATNPEVLSFASDLVMCCVGDFDDSTGSIVPIVCRSSDDVFMTDVSVRLSSEDIKQISDRIAMNASAKKGNMIE